MSNDLFEIIEENPDVTESDIRPRTVVANDYSVFMTEFHSGPVGSPDEAGRTWTPTVDLTVGVLAEVRDPTVDLAQSVRDAGTAPTVDPSRGVRGEFYVDEAPSGNLVDYSLDAMGFVDTGEQRLMEFHETLPADYEPPIVPEVNWPEGGFTVRLYPGTTDLFVEEMRREMIAEILELIINELDVRRTGTGENANDLSEDRSPNVYARNNYAVFTESIGSAVRASALLNEPS